jgi:hypothetical protein
MTMEIEAKLSGDFSCKSIRYYTKGNTRIFNGVLDVRMTEEQISSVFDDAVAGLAFAGVAIDPEGAVSWGYKKITPDVKCSGHLLQLYTKSAAGPEKLGPQLGVMPEVAEIKPAPDEPKVIVSIIFPIEAKDTRLVGALAMAVGEVVTAEIQPAHEPKQDDLPGTQATPTPPVATPTGPHGTIAYLPGVPSPG